MDQSLAQAVRDRAGHACEYCQLPQALSDGPFEIEHILARQHGGRTSLANTAYACLRCNKCKGPNIAGRDPKTRKLAPLFHPRRHKWARHFRWEGARLLGLTPIGRVTILVLAINDPLRVAFRQSLIDEGLFPPSY